MNREHGRDGMNLEFDEIGYWSDVELDVVPEEVML